MRIEKQTKIVRKQNKKTRPVAAFMPGVAIKDKKFFLKEVVIKDLRKMMFLKWDFLIFFFYKVQMLETEQSEVVCTVSETALVESAFLFHCSITPQTDLFCTGGISPGPLSHV